MFFRRKPKGGTGSNQYQTRGESHQQQDSHHCDDIEAPILAGPDLVEQVEGLEHGGPERVRCGDMWGTHCPTWVHPPGYSHDEHPSDDSKIEAATNSSTRRYILDLLSIDQDSYVRMGMARNQSAQPGVLEELASDPDGGIRQGVAGNKSTPLPVLEQLATDEDSWVRLRVAENASAPIPVLARLAVDTDYMVARIALDNPSLPAHIRDLASTVQPSEDI